jgi:hypothetical protein
MTMKMKPRLWLVAPAALCALALAVTALAGGAPGYGGGGKGKGMGMGAATTVQRPAFHGYYDGHKDTYLNTDVSDKAQAQAMHINYAPTLRTIPMMSTPAMYLVEGKAAPGQLAVFGSEPGEPTYNPIWHEVMVTWKASATPVLLVKDDQIKMLASQGQLTVVHTHTMLNCPIIHVGKGGS